MAEFLRVLAATHSVAAAARSVGMSQQSAYTLRDRLKGEPFDIAWETAFQHSYDALHQAALERALLGVEVPVFYKGEQIGTRRHFDERLTCFLLTTRNAQGAQQLGRYRADADFFSERWDDLLEQVEDEAWAGRPMARTVNSAATTRRGKQHRRSMPPPILVRVTGGFRDVGVFRRGCHPPSQIHSIEL